MLSTVAKHELIYIFSCVNFDADISKKRKKLILVMLIRMPKVLVMMNLMS